VSYPVALVILIGSVIVIVGLAGLIAVDVWHKWKERRKR
jgi:hypothetical protein